MFLANPYHDLFRLMQDQSEELRLAARKHLIWSYSWAVPHQEAIATLAELGPLVELGAGTGYWSWLLRMAGADVVALDREPHQPPTWTAIERGDETRVQAYGERALLMCWPPYNEPMAFRAAERLLKGQRLAYIGEMEGRTGDSKFHGLLQNHFALEREVAIPTWPGFRDRLYVFRR